MPSSRNLLAAGPPSCHQGLLLRVAAGKGSQGARDLWLPTDYIKKKEFQRWQVGRVNTTFRHQNKKQRCKQQKPIRKPQSVRTLGHDQETKQKIQGIQTVPRKTKGKYFEI